MFGNLLKAVVGVVVEAPIAIIADAVTLGGAINDKSGGTYTGDAVSKVIDNLDKATK